MPAASIGFSFQPAIADAFLFFRGSGDFDEREFIEVNRRQREGYIQIIVFTLHVEGKGFTGLLIAQPSLEDNGAWTGHLA